MLIIYQRDRGNFYKVTMDENIVFEGFLNVSCT